MRILFWVPYPREGASNRYRVEQYVPYLERMGMRCTIHSFWNGEAFRILYKRGFRIRKACFFIAGTLSRLFDVAQIFRFDIVFIHREAYPLGGAIFEKALARLGKNIIFDFDDAIFLPASSRPNSFVERFKRPGKIADIIKASDFVIVGNNYLSEFALKYNPNTCTIPTSVDTDDYMPARYTKRSDEVVIGWIGSVTTSEFLAPMRDVFKTILAKYGNVRFEIIGGSGDFTDLAGVSERKWDMAREIDDLRGFDIGIMPMPDNEWTVGKCAFKAILYMSMAIPCVSSPVGVNKEVIKDGENGFFAVTEEDWVNKLSRLIEDPELRRLLGNNGRRIVEEKYSVKANAGRLAEVITKVYREGEGQ